VLRLGRLVAIIPWPVIEGFTLGIAVIIFLQQVPSALGLTASDGSPVHSANALVAAVQSFGEIDPVRAAWSVGAVLAVVVIMVVLPRVHRAIPSAIVAILVVSVIATAIDAPLDRIGALPTGLPAPMLPDLDASMLLALAGPALAVAALAAIESLLSARVGAAIADVGRFDADRELVGQGLASVASGLFGGMPATGAIARTAVNVRSGGRTRLAAITHAVVLLVIVLVAGSIVGQIPLAALAGVLMVTAARMVTLSTVRSVVTASRADALVFTTTAVITVAFDLIIAVGIGVVVAAVFALRALARSASVRRDPLPGPACPGDERIALVTIDGAMFFGAAEAVAEQVADVEPAAGGPGADGIIVVIVRMSQVRALDATGARVITELVTTLERRGVTVLLKGIRPEHLELARRVGVVSSLRHHRHLFNTLDDAVEHARDHVRRHGTAAVV
jgi:SulP family sulfate permease